MGSCISCGPVKSTTDVEAFSVPSRAEAASTDTTFAAPLSRAVEQGQDALVAACSAQDFVSRGSARLNSGTIAARLVVIHAALDMLLQPLLDSIDTNIACSAGAPGKDYTW